MNLNEPIGAALLFVGVWIFVCYLTGVLGGWHDLARTYRHPETFDGKQWRFQSGQMRLLLGMNNALTVGVNSHGLYLAVFVPFRVGYPPLLVPWGDLSVCTGKFLFWKYFEFRFRQAPHVYLRLSASLVDKMRVAVGNAWPIDRSAIAPF
ncbi:MAG: hypothetical protein ABSH13_24745 [Candidatus Acidiferrum sp.]|jgi:hypothetical protein